MSFIEVAIGIAGFTAIVAAIRRDSWSDVARVLFPMLWTMSAMIILFSALPLVLATAELSQSLIWQISSCAYGILLVLIVPWRYRRIIAAAPNDNQPTLAMKLLLSVASAVMITLLLVNVILLGVAWPYVTSLLMAIMFAFMTFYQLMQEFWEIK